MRRWDWLDTGLLMHLSRMHNGWVLRWEAVWTCEPVYHECYDKKERLFTLLESGDQGCMSEMRYRWQDVADVSEEKGRLRAPRETFVQPPL